MCQVVEEYPDQLERADLPSVSKKCGKCKEASTAVVIRTADTYCRGCFKEYFVHKFRATLGKNRIIFPGEKVLLAVSGGPSSCAMLNQVQEGLNQNAHKKLRFLPGIIYIDEGCAVNQTVEERQRKVSELQAVFKAAGFPFHIMPLEQVLDLPNSVVVAAPSPSEQLASTYKAAVDHFIQAKRSNDLTAQDQEETSVPYVQESHTQRLQQLIGSAKTLTAREDLLNTLKQHLLVHIARSKGYSKLMLGDNCTRLAVKLLTSISLGRGAQLAQDTGFSDSRYGDIIVVRPMRDYSANEIASYNHMFNVPCVVIPSLNTKTPDRASVHCLTESFVTKLQVDFPSTVSTIYRTSEKLQTAGRSSISTNLCDRCLLCMCTMDTAVEKASAFQATQVSTQLSQAKPTGSPEQPTASGQCCSGAGTEGCGSGVGCCSSASVKTPDLKSLLCYSCQLTIKDMLSVEHLPAYILSEAQRRLRRFRMREDISEFLLDDGDEGGDV
ncbi:cytoplasmic tRNA 2-thiolation protein 2 isoform X2 [Parambassis ranga]|uniref:Cytoplasmic tRNA 2-thiolation protein 2 n=1 Tax=Parambassis ranga TaxID=210632 RepID=A0A6P7JW57_9TELE|nr:cytoplasmic tRNA 2-thiolation protein 2 isoform X2 [Parambassis ranga]